MLAQKGRISFTEDADSWVVRSLRESSLNEAVLTTEVILATRQLSISHRDPADLFLAATAKVFDLTLVTADARLLEEKGIATLANR